MDLVAILDTETTGLSPADGVCLEVAVVRYSLRLHTLLDALPDLATVHCAGAV